MINVVIYARYSSHAQTEQSIEGQLRVCREYCERMGFTVIHEYIDRALSGRYDDRPEFQKMINDAKKKQFQYIIVYKLDRFTRNRYDSAIYKYKLKQYGVKVLSAMEQISDTPEGVILEAVLEASAEYYSLELSQKVKRGMKESALKGNSTGGQVIYGYKIENKKYVIDEDKAPFVKMMFEDYIAGTPIKEIKAKLKTRGLSINSNSTIINMLKNKKYIGITEYGGIVRDDAYPAIIDTDTFEKVQIKINSNKQAPAAKRAKEKYLLQGKLFCGECGSVMQGHCGKSMNGETHHYYKCRKRNETKQCTKSSEKKDFIEWYITEQTVEYVLEPKRMEYIAKRVSDLYNDEFGNSKLRQLENEIKACENEMQKNIDAYIEADNKAIRKQLEAKVDELEASINDMKIDLAKLKNASNVTLTEEQVKAWLKTFTKGELCDKSFQEKIIDALVNSVYLYDDKVVIYFNIENGKQISYIDMLDDLEHLEDEASVLVPNNLVSQICGFFIKNPQFFYPYIAISYPEAFHLFKEIFCHCPKEYSDFDS